MNPFALVFLIVTAAALWGVPRKWAAVPFLVGCCYMTVGQGVSLGGLNFPIVRILVIIGLLRLVLRGEWVTGGMNLVDKLMVFWTIWLIFASLFHVWGPGAGPVYTTGALLNTTGFYFLIRSFCQDADELIDVLAALCVILVPVAVFMVIEQAFKWNLFSVFGGVPEEPKLRNGRYRAQGPFNHAILAGTVGAACLPFAFAIWHRYRVAAALGISASLMMVFSCASSGPIMSTGFGIFAIALWKYRPLVRLMRIMALPVYAGLAIVMERPVYFLISKIDLTGASTGWHRSFLIQQTIAHLNEWWLFGTDRTIHWMPGQGRISDTQTDITNQYIAYGVAGGLICMGIVIAVMLLGFRSVGRQVDSPGVTKQQGFLFWCMGSSLFSLAASGMSVGYFGQALFFFWFPIAALASFYVAHRPEHFFEDEEEFEEFEEFDPEAPEERTFVEGP